MIATCWNFLETSDDLRFETLLPLLMEDYEPRDIENFRPHIEECINHVKREFEFKERVMEEYDRLGISIHSDKARDARSLAAFSPNRDEKGLQHNYGKPLVQQVGVL